MRLAVIDIGSNTAHLLIVDAHPGGAPAAAFSHKIDLRLAEYADSAGAIKDEGEQILTDFVMESMQIAEDMGAARISGFATSATRDASNGADMLARIGKAAGLDLQVLSGSDEARLTFLAVRRWFGWSSGRVLLLDIGGGSFEIAAGLDEEPDEAFSLPLGAGRLTRQFHTQDAVNKSTMKELRRYVRSEVASAVGRVNRLGKPELAVATSKSFRQLARIAGAAPSSEGLYVRRVLSRDDLGQWVPRLAKMSSDERATLPGVSKGRADQLLAGAVVAEAAMDLFGVTELVLCPWALREGIILRAQDLMES